MTRRELENTEHLWPRLLDSLLVPRLTSLNDADRR